MTVYNSKDTNLKTNIILFSFLALFIYIATCLLDITKFGLFKTIFGLYSIFLSPGLLFNFLIFRKSEKENIYALVALSFPLSLAIIIPSYIIFRPIIKSEFFLPYLTSFLHCVLFIMIFIITPYKFKNIANKNNLKIALAIMVAMCLLGLIWSVFIPTYAPDDEHDIYNQCIGLNLINNPLDLRYQEVFPQSKVFITYPSSPLQYLCWSYVLQIAGKSPEGFRSLNILFYLLNILFIYAFCKDFGGKKRAFFSIAIYLSSYYALYNLQKTNVHLIVATLFLISAYFFFGYLKNRNLIYLNIAMLYASLSGLFQEIFVSFLPLLLMTVTLLLYKRSFDKNVINSYKYYLFPLAIFLFIGFLVSGKSFIFHVIYRTKTYFNFSSFEKLGLLPLDFSALKHFSHSWPLIVMFLLSIFTLTKNREDNALKIWVSVFISLGIYMTIRDYNDLVNLFFFFPLVVVLVSGSLGKLSTMIFSTALLITFIIINFNWNYLYFHEIKNRDIKKTIPSSALYSIGDISKDNKFFIIGKEAGVVTHLSNRYCEQDTLIFARNESDFENFRENLVFINDYDSFFTFSKNTSNDRKVSTIKFSSSILEETDSFFWKVKFENFSGDDIVAVTPVIELVLADGRYLIKKLFISKNRQFNPQVYSFLFEEGDINFLKPNHNFDFFSGKQYSYYRSLKNEVKSVDYKFLVISRDKGSFNLALYPIQ